MQLLPLLKVTALRLTDKLTETVSLTRTVAVISCSYLVCIIQAKVPVLN